MNMTADIRAWQLDRIFRVRDWSYLLGIPCLALAPYILEATFSTFLRVAVYGVIYLAWGYGFNNFFDCEEDSDQKNAFRNMSRTQAILLVTIAGLVFLLLGLKLQLFGETVLVMAVNAAYSVQPLRLKRFLLPSLLANGFFFSMLYLASAKIIGLESKAQLNAMVAYIFVLFLPFQYVHFLEDNGPKNAPILLWEKLGLVGFMLPLALLTFISGIPEMAQLRFLSLGFILSSSALMANVRTPREMRLHLRFLGMAVGLFLLVERLLLWRS